MSTKLRSFMQISAPAFLSLASVMQASAQVGPVYDPYSNSQLYLVGSATSSWTEAEADAQALGGNLVTIHSAAENSFITSTFFANLTSQGGPDLSNGIGLWMGLWDPIGIQHDDAANHAADFVWVDGETEAYRNWNSGEPNDDNGGEYNGMIWGPNDAPPIGGSAPEGTWNDSGNTFSNPLYAVGFYGIAEVRPAVPEPSPLAVLGLGLLVPLLRRRKRGLRQA